VVALRHQSEEQACRRLCNSSCRRISPCLRGERAIRRVSWKLWLAFSAKIFFGYKLRYLVRNYLRVTGFLDIVHLRKPKYRKHNVPETRSVSGPISGEADIYSVRSLKKRANFNQWTTHVSRIYAVRIFLLHLLDSSWCKVYIELLLHDKGCPVTEISSF
jgi:hypothetical protein